MNRAFVPLQHYFKCGAVHVQGVSEVSFRYLYRVTCRRAVAMGGGWGGSFPPPIHWEKLGNLLGNFPHSILHFTFIGNAGRSSVADPGGGIRRLEPPHHPSGFTFTRRKWENM